MDTGKVNETPIGAGKQPGNDRLNTNGNITPVLIIGTMGPLQGPGRPTLVLQPVLPSDQTNTRVSTTVVRE